MPALLLIVWQVALFGLCACSILVLREAKAGGASQGQSQLIAFVYLSVVPPIMEFVCCAVMLFNASPTMQFNAGSWRAMGLWSFWVHWWPTVLFCTALQAGLYLVWLMVTFSTKCHVSLRSVICFALLASLSASLLLSMAYPTA